ncbi:MAG TPA: methyl-accepting chemotaxis protein [Phycisphaerales bacterium]|nr:methyl-accepting chemotaxis protein [Phycisphaerales bacterium]
MSLSLLFTLYGMLMYRFVELSREGADLPVEYLVVLSSVVALFIAAGIVAVNVLAAHRIAGVHIKLLKTFKSVQEGDFSARLRFRKDDKLEEVEAAFNSMMEVVESKTNS